MNSLNENRNIGYKWTRIEFCYTSAGIAIAVSFTENEIDRYFKNWMLQINFTYALHKPLWVSKLL